MSRNPFAYARLGNCEKSSASISASGAGRILVMRAASSRVRLRARLASSNFLTRPSIVMMGLPAKRQRQDRQESPAVWRLRRDPKYRAAPEYQRCAQHACNQVATAAAAGTWKHVFPVE